MYCWKEISAKKVAKKWTYLVVNGVVINHNKGSWTASLYLSLKSIKIVKTFIPRTINFVHSKLFTSINFSVGHINFVSFLELLFQNCGSQSSIFLEPIKHLVTHPEMSHPYTSACPPNAVTLLMRVWVPLYLPKKIIQWSCSRKNIWTNTKLTTQKKNYLHCDLIL